MASTWKLTKKLKETHLSAAFLRGGNGTSNGTASESQSRSNTLVKPPNGAAIAKPGVDAQPRPVSGDDLETPRASISEPSGGVARIANGTGAGAGTASRDATISASSSTSTTASTSPSASTATNPALLRVKVYDIKDLIVPESIISKLPPWALDKSSTRPPPIHLVLEYDKTQIILHAIGGTAQNPTWDKTSSFDKSVKEPLLCVSVYVRVMDASSGENDDERLALAEQPPHSETGTDGPSASAAGTVGRGSGHRSSSFKDVLLSTLRLDTSSHLSGSYDLPGNAGKLRVRSEMHQTKNQPLTIDNFSLLKVVGKGSFGKVMQVRKKDTHQIYALKTLRKAHIVSRSEVGHTLAERTVLAKISNPFIVPLKFSFQSPEKLYLVLAFINGGELFHHLQREGRFDLNRARFYTAELLCALECLHEYNVIYRDLKPENILLDYTGHIALCDFGLCKLNMAGQEKTNTFCGTPEYLAPELLLGQGYTKVVDYWTLGVLFYEMLTGLPPFYDQDTNKMYHKILQNPLVFPSDMDQEAKSLLTGLLERNPTRRLGVNGAAEIKAHPFFRQIDWKCLLNKKYAAPFQPSVASATDTSNFDQEFTNEVPTDSVVDKDLFLSESVQKQFGGWSYTNTDSKLASSGKW